MGRSDSASNMLNSRMLNSRMPSSSMLNSGMLNSGMLNSSMLNSSIRKSIIYTSMMSSQRMLRVWQLSLLAVMATACGLVGSGNPEASKLEADKLGYNPNADTKSSLAAAKTEATAQHKRILLIGGGDWCRWCHILDRFLSQHPTINTQLQRDFVIVKMYIGDDDRNRDVLATLPEARGYPHFWVLSADGKIIASVATTPLEKGINDYDANAFADFVRSYAIEMPR